MSTHPDADNPYASPQADGSAPDCPAHAVPAGPPIRFRGVLSVPDAFHACGLALRTKPRVVAAWIARGLCLLVFVSFAAFFVSAVHHGDAITARLSIVINGALAFVGAVAVGRVLWYRLRARALWRRREGLFAETDTVVAAEALGIYTATANMQLSWGAFCAYRFSDRVLVLYQAFPGVFTIFARAKLENDADWPRFLDLVAGKLPRR